MTFFKIAKCVCHLSIFLATSHSIYLNLCNFFMLSEWSNRINIVQCKLLSLRFDLFVHQYIWIWWILFCLLYDLLLHSSHISEIPVDLSSTHIHTSFRFWRNKETFVHILQLHNVLVQLTLFVFYLQFSIFVLKFA